jgi:transcriptional regulator with XRE-family HTH domain
MILRDHVTLKKLMILQKVSQRQLAKAAGYRAHSYVSRLVRGEERTISTDAALRIAHRLDVAVGDLFLPGPSTKNGRDVHSGDGK